MYCPSAFRQTDLSELHGLIRAEPFAALVSSVQGTVQASHLPLWLAAEQGEFGTLYGHFARANPHWRALREQPQALAIFSGAHAYVSPSWYPSKAEDGKAVPTWNYQAVHAQGQIQLIEEPQALLQLLRDLSDTHEASQTTPWSLDEAPAEYLDNMLKALVGFAMPITRLEGQWKLSQNRSVADQTGVHNNLRVSGKQRDQRLAQLMPIASQAHHES